MTPVEGRNVVKQLGSLNEPEMTQVVPSTEVVNVVSGRVVRTLVTFVNVEPVGRTSVVVKVATWEQVVVMVG